MTSPTNLEDIWERSYKNLSLTKFKRARTEKGRLRALKKALKDDKFAKNLLKMNKNNIQQLSKIAFAKELTTGEKGKQLQLKQFNPKKQKEIREIEKNLRISNARKTAISRAEAKGVKFLEIKEKPAQLGRPVSTKTLAQNIKIVRFTQGKNEYIATYARGIGRKGIITKEKIV